MKHTFVMTIAVVLLAVAVPLGVLVSARMESESLSKERSSSELDSGPEAIAEIQHGDYRLSGPFTHQNLTIYLIHGKNLIEGRSFLTLQEALEQRKVVVYETKDVNELSIRNRSGQDIYVQAGDIVKGGQQDRVLAVDLIVPPRSGRMPIAAFCVESGRWNKREGERAEAFSSSAEVVPTKSLKLAAKSAKSQGAVWENVTVAQDKLSENVGARVNSTVSDSSLQLAVENRKVQETAAGYSKALAGVVQGQNDVIGYVFVINGKVNSADVYASSVLFKKLWPKLLKANAIEAIAELQKDLKFEPASADSVRAFLAEAESNKPSEKDVTARIRLVTREDENNVLFETQDRSQNRWIHRNYIRK
jgi:ARG and Rhodanese-Phosphatase-superfamily-associated Protein domain